jgi:hypothetical protein
LTSGNSVVDLICSMVNIHDTSWRSILDDQSLVKIIIGANIGNHRTDQIVDISAQSIEIHGLRKTDHNLPEPLNPFGIVLVDLDRDENADAKVELIGVKAARNFSWAFLDLSVRTSCTRYSSRGLAAGTDSTCTRREMLRTQRNRQTSNIPLIYQQPRYCLDFDNLLTL